MRPKLIWYRTEYVFSRAGQLVAHRAIVREWGTGGNISYSEDFKTPEEAMQALKARFEKDEAERKKTE